MDLIERAGRKIADGKPDKGASAQPSSPSAEAREASRHDQPANVPVPYEERVEPDFEEQDELEDEEFEVGPVPHGGHVAQIDIDHLERLGYLSPRHPVTRIAEEFRVLKRRVLTNIVKSHPEQTAESRVIMVTSSQPGEGKTFLTINLALSIAAERDKHVLLIDGDFAHPGVFRTLGLKRQLGFLDILRDPSMDLGDVISRTDVERLSLVDSGRSSSIATEFLSSDKMQRLVAEITHRYEDRIILFDAPPMLATSEPSILSHHAGQILFVVEAGRTSERAVKTALEMIYDRDKVMMVLNKTKTLIGSQPFGSYYYYYKTAGRKPDEPKGKPAGKAAAGKFRPRSRRRGFLSR